MAAVSRNDFVQFLRDEISIRASLANEDVANDALLSSLGLSSLDVVLISGALEDRFDIEVDPTLMYEHQTIDAVAEYLSKSTNDLCAR